MDNKEVKTNEVDAIFPVKINVCTSMNSHICAMAKTSGGYLVLGMVQHKIEKTNHHFIGFKKRRSS